MWSIQDISAEELAKLFHHYHGALAHDFDCSGNSTDASWDRTPQEKRKLMVAAARLTLMELAASPSSNESRPYFAKPGEADWGC